jgi:hypothetical protein
MCLLSKSSGGRAWKQRLLLFFAASLSAPIAAQTPKHDYSLALPGRLVLPAAARFHKAGRTEMGRLRGGGLMSCCLPTVTEESELQSVVADGAKVHPSKPNLSDQKQAARQLARGCPRTENDIWQIDVALPIR